MILSVVFQVICPPIPSDFSPPPGRYSLRPDAADSAGINTIIFTGSNLSVATRSAWTGGHAHRRSNVREGINSEICNHAIMRANATTNLNAAANIICRIEFGKPAELLRPSRHHAVPSNRRESPSSRPEISLPVRPARNTPVSIKPMEALSFRDENFSDLPARPSEITGAASRR